MGLVPPGVPSYAPVGVVIHSFIPLVVPRPTSDGPDRCTVTNGSSTAVRPLPQTQVA